MKSKVVTFKAREDFYAHIEAEARRRGLPVGTYIKAVLAKFSKFKQKAVI
jgi:predicted DNA binding CopG/RHH family protein